jgi:hypothetical protein
MQSPLSIPIVYLGLNEAAVLGQRSVAWPYITAIADVLGDDLIERRTAADRTCEA